MPGIAVTVFFAMVMAVGAMVMAVGAITAIMSGTTVGDITPEI